MSTVNSAFACIAADTFEYSLVGKGDKTIIFLNGFRMPMSSWGKVYPAIAQKYRVLLFNRLGVGKSSKALSAQDGRQVIEDFHQLLLALKLEPPFILVGHSLGGIFASLFAATYKQAVSGIVFVEAPHPLEIVQQKLIRPPLLLRLLNDGCKYVEKIFDPYKFSEDETIVKTLAQLGENKDLPDIPIAVVSGTQKMPFVPEVAFRLHERYQKELLTLSPLAKHYCCDKSGHFPQFSEPQVVIAAILDIAAAIVDSNHQKQELLL